MASYAHFLHQTGLIGYDPKLRATVLLQFDVAFFELIVQRLQDLIFKIQVNDPLLFGID